MNIRETMNWNGKIALTGENCHNAPIKFHLNNQTFLLARKTDDRVVYYLVYVLGSPNEAKHYSHTLKLFGPKTTHTFEGQVAAIDESFETLFEAGKYFTYPHKAFMAQFLNEDRKYEYSLQIRNLNEEAKDENYESGISDNDEDSKK